MAGWNRTTRLYTAVAFGKWVLISLRRSWYVAGRETRTVLSPNVRYTLEAILLAREGEASSIGKVGLGYCVKVDS